jgi:tetratricopeptide (TPR) repeat protein
VKETPPDVQIHKVLDIDLTNRNVNLWEKGLIDEGRQAEVEGYLDHAVSSLTRAGINSKEPHLSKLFLGSLYFRNARYLSAIDNYSEALRMIWGIKSSSMYNKGDEFVAKFNRAIAYFRTGNDTEGIKDLEDALKVSHKIILIFCLDR